MKLKGKKLNLDINLNNGTDVEDIEKLNCGLSAATLIELYASVIGGAKVGEYQGKHFLISSQVEELREVLKKEGII